MGVYKIVTGIGQTVMGASEAWYSPDRSANDVADVLNELLRARNKILYDTTYWTGVRSSLYGSERRSVLFLPGKTLFPDTKTDVEVPERGYRHALTAIGGPDQFRAIIQWQPVFDTDRTATRYISNIPDKISATEAGTINVVGDPQWYDDFQAYLGLLINRGWQVRARLRTGDYVPWPIQGVVLGTQTTPLLGIEVDATSAPPFARGKKVTLSKWRPPKGERRSTINGAWTIDSVTTTGPTGTLTIYLRGSAGILPGDVRFTDASRIQLVGYSLYPVTGFRIRRVGIHKRGKPLGSPVGRRLSRPSLDP